MRIYCPFCQDTHSPLLERAGSHIKASCPITGKYLKFLTQTPEVLSELQTQQEEGARPKLFDD